MQLQGAPLPNIDRDGAAASPQFLALACVGLIASATPAQAQSTAEDSAAGPKLGGMTVTDTAIVDEAYKPERKESPKAVAPLLDTPRSVVVIDKQVIKDTGSATLVEALRTVPGITFGAAEGGNPIGDRPFIRGFDSQGSTFLDGVRDIGAQSREIFAVEQVQIVRGSDSTLGGRGSAGGSINIVSKMPERDTFVAASGSYGNADYKRVTGDVNYRVNEMVAVRINGMWHDQDVAGRDALFQKRWGIAPSVTIGVDSPTRLTLMYYHLHTDELPDSGFPYATIASSATTNAPAGFSFSEPAIGDFTTRGGVTGRISPKNFYGLVDRDFRRTNVDQFTVRGQHDFGGVTLRNTARYGHSTQAYIYTQPDDSQGNVTGLPTGGRNLSTGAIFNPYTAGGRVWRRANTRFGTTESMTNQTDLYGKLTLAGMEHSFAVGGEFSFERAQRGAYVVNAGASNAAGRCTVAPGTSPYNCADLFNPNPNDPWVNYVAGSTTAQTPIVRGTLDTQTINRASTRGLYAFDSITVLPSLIVNLGLRYDDFRSRTALPVVLGSRPTVSRKDRIWNYQAGAVFKPTANTSVYANYSTAATPPNSLIGEGQEGNSLGTVTGASPAAVAAALAAAQAAANDILKVERTKSLEVGAKADLFDSRLSLTAAAFRTRTKNARITSDQNTVAYVGERRIKGVELGFNGNVTDAWNIFGGYTYLDAKIVDGGSTILTAAAVGAQAAKTISVASVNTGREFPQVAKHSFTLFTNYKIIPRLEIGGGAIYSSRVYGGYADNRYAVQNAAGVVTVVPATAIIARSVPSYWRFDARAAFKVNDQIDIAANLQNLTDKRYFSAAYTSHYALLAPGRTGFVTLNVKY